MDREVMYSMRDIYHATKRRDEFVNAVREKHPTVREGQALAAWEAFDVCAEDTLNEAIDAKPSDERTLRDKFAGKALAGLVNPNPTQMPTAAVTAKNAYYIADAMIAEREKGTEQ